MLHTLIKKFLEANIGPEDSIALALSGGPDSMALLHLLLPFQNKNYKKLYILHVDHRWREESTEEASFLENICNDLNLPFIKETLTPPHKENNLEDGSRKKRLVFFKKMQKKWGFKGIFTGHQFEDQTETILKRVLEGTSLPFLKGILSRGTVEGIEFFRPLLKVKKEELITFLNGKGVSFFTDPTNRDPRFLRARFREELFPFLERSFGKKVDKPLYKIGEEAARLHAFLEQEAAASIVETLEGPLGRGWVFDVKTAHPYVLEHFFHNFHLLSKEEGMRAAEALKKKKADCRIGPFYIDRGRAFLLKEMKWQENILKPLHLGSFTWGCWQVVVEQGKKELPPPTWKDVLKGKVVFSLPKGDYFLDVPRLESPFSGKRSLSRFWTDKKVPAIFRFAFPVVCKGKEVVFEALSGSSRLKGSDLKIIIRHRESC